MRRLERAAAVALVDRAPCFVKSAGAEVRASRLTVRRTWRTARGDAMRARAGDWLVEQGSEEWTVAAAVFEERYEEVRPGVFRSRQAIRAVRVEEPLEIETLEGWVHAASGDLLALGPAGDVWPIPAERFAATYRPAPAGAQDNVKP